MDRTLPHLRSVVSQDGAIILDIKNNTLLTLNPTGGYIWARLRQGKCLDDIICDLARDTGMALAVVERDVDHFLEELKSKGVLA
jgi:hypothetical protein